MGIGSSSELPPPGEGHHALFYDGVKALSEGRYTSSESFFQQVIKRHSGRAFWDGVITAAVPPSMEGRMHTGRSDTASAETELGAHGKLTILLPVDSRYVEIHDFARLISDIALNYYYKAVALGTHAEADMVRRVGMMYSGYLAVRVQVLLYMLHNTLAECVAAREAADALAEERKNAAFVAPSVHGSIHNSLKHSGMIEIARRASMDSKTQFSATNPPPTAVLMKVLSLKEECITMWVSSIISYANAALQCAALIPSTKEGEAHRRKIMNMAWNCCNNLLLTIKNVARVYKSLKTANLIKSLLVELRQFIVTSGYVTDNMAEIVETASQQSDSSKTGESKMLSNAALYFSLDLGGKTAGGGENRTFWRTARNMHLGMQPILPIMSLYPVRLEIDLECDLTTRLPHTLHPMNRSVFHYLDWILRDLKAPPLFAGKNDHFLQMNDVTMPLDETDLRAFKVVMGEEVCLLCYPVMFLVATLFRLVDRTEAMPKMIKKATELAITTYGGDSPMCHEINELFKKYFGSSM